MEIPSIWFFPFFSFISILFLRIGFQAFDKATISFPNQVLTNLFKSCLAFSVFYSSTYSFFCRPFLENEEPDTHLCYGRGNAEFVVSTLCTKALLILYIDTFPTLFIVLASVWLLILNFKPFLFPSLSSSEKRPVLPSIRMHRCHNYCGGLSIVVLFKIGYNLSAAPKYCAAFICFLILVSYTATFLIKFHPSFKRLFSSIQTTQSNITTFFAKMYDKRKIIEWGIGVLASIFYQYYFRKTTIDLLLAFLCFAVSWLGNLAMVQPSSDFGIFNFLITNSVISSAVNLFGIGIYTWLVFLVCTVLVALRLKVQSVSLVYLTDFITN